MTPLALRIAHFRSFRGMQTFTFPRGPGLFFMRGVNEEEVRLEANGAGKSTVWEALYWCCFGQTSKGLKAGNVCNWDVPKGTEVEFDFETEDECVWTLRRTWSPNTWTLERIADGNIIDLVKEKDNPFLTWLALSMEPFLHSIYMAQSEPMFLDLKREPQAALFSSVMSLDVWLDYAAKASKRASEMDKQCREMDRELASLEGELRGLGNQDFTVSAEEWDRKQLARAEEIEVEWARFMRSRSTLKEERDRYADEEVVAQDALRAIHEGKAGEDIKRTELVAKEYASILSEEHVKRTALHDHLDLLEADKKCPVCGQTLTHDEWRKEMDKAEGALAQTNKVITRYERELRGAEDKLRQLSTALAGAELVLETVRTRARNARNDFDLLERKLDGIEEAAEALKTERNPYRDMERDIATRGRRLREAIEEQRTELDTITERYALYSFWVRGFKELRLSLIAEALTELEIEVNSCCDALGLIGWELNFDIDRETKAGKIERGFNCFVRSPHNKDAVPWEVWSGGEAQRLRIAATMGLGDLIRSRTGSPLQLEVWDEPTSGLSAQGIRDLLECLAERAQREQRQIWIVDHRAYDFGGFAGTAIITKTADGSEIATEYN